MKKSYRHVVKKPFLGKMRCWAENNKSIVEIIGLFSNLLVLPIAAASSYFAYQAINESKAQLKASYQPKIIPLPLFVRFLVTCNGDGIKKMISETSFDGDVWYSGERGLRVANIGKGVANNVSYNWDVGSESQRQHLIKLGLTWNPIGFNFKEYPDSVGESVVNDPYLLPSDQSKFSSIKSPSYLVGELKTQVERMILHYKCQQFRVLSGYKGPNLAVDYMDIGKNRINQYYSVSYVPTPYRISNEGKPNRELKIPYKVVFQ